MQVTQRSSFACRAIYENETTIVDRLPYIRQRSSIVFHVFGRIFTFKRRDRPCMCILIFCGVGSRCKSDNDRRSSHAMQIRQRSSIVFHRFSHALYSDRSFAFKPVTINYFAAVSQWWLLMAMCRRSADAQGSAVGRTAAPMGR